MVMVRLALASGIVLAEAQREVLPELLPTLLIDSPQLGVVGILVIFLYIEFAEKRYDQSWLVKLMMRCMTTDSPV
jgi:hypothetical protein